ESQDPAADARAERREALERLRDALWQYAATHNGRFPAEGDAAIDPDYWHIPGWPGVTFIRLKPAKAENIGRLLVMEPELDDDQRHVLLSNGFVGTMRSAEIRQALQAEMDRETQRLSHTADQQLPQQP